MKIGDGKISRKEVPSLVVLFGVCLFATAVFTADPAPQQSPIANQIQSKGPAVGPAQSVKQAVNDATAMIGHVSQVIPVGKPCTISWTASPGLGPIDIALMSETGGTLRNMFFIARSVPANSGSFSWTPSADSFPAQPYSLKIQLSNAATGKVYSASTSFTVVGMAFDAPKKGDKMLAESPYLIKWHLVGGDPTLPISLYLWGNGLPKQLLPGTPKSGDGSLLWSKASPAGIQAGDFRNFRLEARPSYSATAEQIVAVDFTFAFPTLTVAVQSPADASITDTVYAGKPYDIRCKATGLPASSFRIDIVDMANQTAEAVAGSWSIKPSGSGSDTFVSYAWTPSSSHPAAFYGKSYKVRMAKLAGSEYVQVVDSAPFVILKTASSTSSGNATGATGTGTTTSSTVNTSVTSGSGHAGTPGSTASASQYVQQDTKFYYNNSSTAWFQGSVWVDQQGFVTAGRLAADSDLEYGPGRTIKISKNAQIQFKNGYLTAAPGPVLSKVTLEYAAGKTATFDSSGMIIAFQNGYVKSGMLSMDSQFEYGPNKKVTCGGRRYIEFANGYLSVGAMTINTPLEYRAGKSVTVTGNLGAKFSGGWMQWGVLLNEEYLEYRPGQTVKAAAGEPVTFANGYLKIGVLAADTSLAVSATKSQVFHKGVCVQFDSTGYASYGTKETVTIK